VTTPRVVRVFISSTFRDFAEERDLLVRKVFPELRRKCRERQVELVDVDLRWGITEKEARKGKVLPICLAEIDRSRPYFIGCLAERYGWIPAKEQYDVSLLVEQPWLREHLGSKSVTELEILHGVLNNTAMAGQAFFYFRDPRYAQKRGAAYLSAGQEEKAKLEVLKARIRSSGFPVSENYRNPETLAMRVQEDLWRMIDAAYPESEVPDALMLERRKHESYGAPRLRLYLGGERYFKILDGAMSAKVFEPVLVTGQSGGGKSALLANWVNRWQIQHPQTVVVVHHLGSGADATNPVRIVVRLIQEIATLTGEEFQPEIDPEKQLEQLPLWLAAASAWALRCERELLLVLDGLDKLSDRKHLRWFPTFLPQKVKLVASCLEGEILQAAEGCFEWKRLMVKPFKKAAKKRLIKDYLWRFRKTLTPAQSRLLLSHPLSGNPLFLLTVLEELRVFGVHEEVEQRLASLLSPPPSKKSGDEPTVDDAFEHVLARIEEDLGRRRVQKAMEAIWASRAGLFNDELLGIAKIAPAHWAAIQNALDEAFYESGGRINFGHDYLRKAVEDRYGLRGREKRRLHRRVAEWFKNQNCFFVKKHKQPNARKIEELPYQLVSGGKCTDIELILTDPEFLAAACACRQLSDILHFFCEADVLSASSEFSEWRTFLEKHIFLIESKNSHILPVTAFFQLALESGTSHPMRSACAALVLKEFPDESIYVSLLAFRRASYRQPLEVFNSIQVDGAGTLLEDVVVLDENYFASFGENHELWHFIDGLILSTNRGGGLEKCCYSRQSLVNLVTEANLKSLDARCLDFDKIERELKLRRQWETTGIGSYELALNSSHSIHWSAPEFGCRGIDVKNSEGITLVSLSAHADSVSGVAIIDNTKFLTWGWDSRIVMYSWDPEMLPRSPQESVFFHKEEPNRCILNKNSNQILVWTYRPSMDDLGYDEDDRLSVWDYSSGRLQESFVISPYPRMLTLYENGIKFSILPTQTDESEFRFESVYLFKRSLGKELGYFVCAHREHREKGQRGKIRANTEFRSYASHTRLNVLADVDRTFVLTSATGQVSFVKKLDRINIKCFL